MPFLKSRKNLMSNVLTFMYIPDDVPVRTKSFVNKIKYDFTYLFLFI